MTALGIDLQIEYVEADQYSTTITTRLATSTDLADIMFLESRQRDAEQPDQSRHAYQRG